MQSFQTVGIIGKRHDLQIVPTLQQLCTTLRQLDRKLLVEAGTPTSQNLPADIIRLPRAELAKACDLAVVVGGDGTLLSAARDLAPSGVPIVGVNQGRLGFMVDVRPEEMRETFAAIFAGDYLREERLLLQVHLPRQGRPDVHMLAINDVVIRNQAAIRMLEFDTWLDEEFISSHRADGYIVSSPTGSTAYALSGGGPVMHPGLQALALVPICPHTLSDRPIIIGCEQTVRISLRGAPGVAAMLTCDGQTAETLRAGESFEVRKAAFPLTLVHPRNYSYFNLLRNKLHWGRGPALNGSSL
ncbi:NAD+ kinase [Solimonas aquatica]|uniref:NAD kinase n=1 Tax=Solimonas aquatica TaxID=489703 RepID=A0A1H8ZD87_9GAMM|nr:NAD(+) kinase [Solimonas aquatica]SEP62343.1 NAD+ kinase [Solimonas aquatica]